jgi:hypothetical protein
VAAPAVRIEGLAALVRDLERYGVATGDLKDAFGAISQDVAEEAADRIRVKTGAHRASIRPARTKNKAVVRAGNAGNAPAAGVLNYARPGDQFLTGPANENLEAKVARIETELDQLVQRYRLD